MASRGHGPSWATWAVRALCVAAGFYFIWLALTDSPTIGGGLGFGLPEAAVLGIGAITVLGGLLPPRFSMPFALLLTTVLVVLTLTELVLSSVLGPKYYTAYAFDPRYLFRLEPGVSRQYTHLPANGGGTVTYRINSDGFRGEDLEDGDKPRVMVYGDSFIHAEFSELEDSFPVQLEARLRDAAGGDVEVVNAGVAGYGPDQILRRMEDELGRFEPDLVLVSLFSGNDYGDLLRNKLYRLSQDGTPVENDWRLSPEQERQIALNEHEPVLRRLVGEAMRTLRGGGTAETFEFDPQAWIEAALAQHQAEYEAFVEQGNDIVGSFGMDPYSADVALFPGSASADYKIRLLDGIVARMRSVADEHGVPLAIMVVPHPMDLLGGDHSSGFVDRARYPDYDPTRLSGTMVEIARRNDVPVLDLFPVFEGEDVNALFLRGGDDHWNAAGQALAADAAAGFLLGEELLGNRP